MRGTWVKKSQLQGPSSKLTKDEKRKKEQLAGLTAALENNTCAKHDKFLGSGAFGSVCSGVYKDSTGSVHDVAIKFSNSLTRVDASKALRNELAVFDKLHKGHPNIVRCLGGDLGDAGWPFEKSESVKLKGEQYFVVLELMPQNLAQLIHKDPEFTENCTYGDLLELFWDITAGLQFLHEHNIVHYDLKPENVLVDLDGKAKLADFGASKIRFKRSISVQFCGTPGYMAPEVCWGGYAKSVGGSLRVNECLDIYSLGVIMWECVSRMKPGGDDSTMSEGSVSASAELKNQIYLGNSRFSVHETTPKALRELVADCVYFKMMGADMDFSRPNCMEIMKRLEEMLKEPWAKNPTPWATTDEPVVRSQVYDSVMSIPKLNNNINVTRTKLVAMGPYSRVETGEYVDEDGVKHQVAIKESYRVHARFRHELRLFGKIPHHPNLVTCLGGRMEDPPFIVHALNTMDLGNFLSKRHYGSRFDKRMYSYRLLIKIWRDVAKGLQHLHDHHVLYNNLGSTNVLLDIPESNPNYANITAKLGSLLFAETVKGEEFKVRAMGEVNYMPPEAILGWFRHDTLLTKAVDVYSLGAIMVECLMGEQMATQYPRVINMGLGESHDGSDIGKGEGVKDVVANNWKAFDHSEDDFPVPLRDLIEACTRWDPSKRPKLAEVSAILKEMLTEPWSKEKWVPPCN